MAVQTEGVLLLQDSSRTVIRLEEVDAVRRSRNPRRVYIMMGNTSHVFTYESVEKALEDFEKVVSSMGDSALSLNDEEPTVVDKTAVIGVRDFDFKEELIVMFPSWTLISRFVSLADRLEAYDKLVEALSEQP